MRPTELIARIRQVAQISDQDEDWVDTEILTEATQALEDHFPTTLVNLASGYWLQRMRVNTVPGQKIYQIPTRAIANGLAKIEISQNGGADFYAPSVLTVGQSTDYDNNSQGIPYSFGYEGDSIVFYPTPNTALVVQYSYYIRPSTLVATASGGLVQSVGANSVTCDAPDSILPSFPWTLDCIHTHGSCELSLVDCPYTLSGNTYTFPVGTDMSRVMIGDVVRYPETTNYIPLPRELHRSLADYTAAVILAAKGDFDKAGVLSAKAEKSRTSFIDLAAPRVKNAPFEFRTRNTYLRRRVGFGVGRGWR